MKIQLMSCKLFALITFTFILAAGSAVGQTQESKSESSATELGATQEEDSVLAEVVKRYRLPSRTKAMLRDQFIKRELRDIKRKSRRILKHVVGTFWVDDLDRLIDRNDSVIGIWGVDSPQAIPMRPMPFNQLR